MSKKKARNQDVRENRFLEVWRQFRRNKGAMIGLAITIVLIVIAIFADQIWDYKTDVTGINIAERLQGPSLAHPFGTDPRVKAQYVKN